MKAKRKFGLFLMIVGIVLVGAAAALFMHNQREDEEAGSASEQVLPELKEHTDELNANKTDADGATYESDENEAMTEMMIDGYSYIGYLSIPTLDLQLPVMSEWNYKNLRRSPCRYSGSTKTYDLVICAHNYARHFGNIKTLKTGDEVDFTDMDGETTQYSVVAVEILKPTDVVDMSASGYELTLFTCTYGGASRVTVRCDRVQDAGNAS